MIGLAAASILSVVCPKMVSAAQIEVREVRVFDDSKQPVVSHVRLAGPDGKETPVDDTESDGVLREKFICPVHNRIVAEPVAGTYRKSPPQACNVTISIRVWSPDLTKALFARAENESSKGSSAVAALLYNEAFQRANGVDSSIAEAARVGAIVSTAKALNVVAPKAPDPLQGKIVPDAALVDAVSEFQQQKGLRVTGKIDGATLKSLAGTPVAPFIAKATE